MAYGEALKLRNYAHWQNNEKTEKKCRGKLKQPIDYQVSQLKRFKPLYLMTSGKSCHVCYQCLGRWQPQ